MKKFYILTLLMLIFIVGDTYAPQQVVVEPPKFPVGVYVTCDDESLKNFIESHLKRELRALRDVEVVDGVIFHIHILVVKHTYESGRKMGTVSLATMFLKLYDFHPLTPYMTHDQILAMMRDHGAFYYSPKLLLSITSKEKIKEWCEETVANFDIEMLEPERKKR